MLQLQRTFQASAKVITIASELMAELLQTVG
jgi:flagellar hook-associated protein FlgK